MAERETTDMDDARSWDMDNPDKSGPVKKRRTVVSVSLPSDVFQIGRRGGAGSRAQHLAVHQGSGRGKSVAGPRRSRRVVGGELRVGRELPQSAVDHVRPERRRAAQAVHRRERPRLHLGLSAGKSPARILPRAAGE